jgi:hypothetical protein
MPDIPEVLRLSREFYDEMDFDRFGYHFDPVTIEETYRHAVEHPDKFVCLVSERSGMVNGVFLAAVLNRTLYFAGHKFAQEIVWHAKPSLPTTAKGRIMMSLLAVAERRLSGVPFYLSTDIRNRFSGLGDWLERRGYKEMCRYWHKGA